jgi:NAD(P)H-dependent flavin oxidoreductase YrpB (nitropropane dioxygenase family)
MDVAFSHPIKLIVNALGPPPPDMIERAHAGGVLVGALAGKKSHAVRHVAFGVDIIIAQGHEAGGHTGDIGTMVLVPEIVDAVAPTPVLAAGGIGSGRQVAASLALGAQGVWCGSVWLTTQEAETHPIVKEKFLTATSSDTLRSRSRTGKPARQLRSAWTDEWEGESSPGTLPMPLQPMLIAQASRRVDRAATNPENRGAVELANYFVGQIVGSMNESISATRVVEDMITEYLDVMDRFEQLNT